MPLTMDDVTDICSSFPEVVEVERHGRRAWSVGGKVFAWQRPLSKADVKRLGTQPVPQGELLAISCAHLGEKEALLAANLEGVFTIEHFNSYPAVLVRLEVVTKQALREVLLDGWLAAAPARLTDGFTLEA